MFLASKLRRVSNRISLRSSREYACRIVLLIVVLAVIQFSLYKVWKRKTVDNSDRDSLELHHDDNFHSPKPDRSAWNASVTPIISQSSVVSKKLFGEGKWDSSFVSPFHRHYSVNCAAIIRGDREAITTATKVLKANRQQIPLDPAVKNWTSDCDHYRNTRRYPSTARSKEEVEFPIAYIIVAHTESSQLERLLRAVYQPQNVYCIHPDAKSPAPFQAAVRSLAACFPNVFIASNPVRVNYAHSSRLQADVNCMSDLLLRPEPWRYVINLCTNDYPLKTNLELVKQLKAFQGYNDIPGITAPDWFTDRTGVHHEFRNNMMIKMKDVKKPPPPQEFKFFFGNAYYAATRDFTNYVIHNQTAINLLKYSEDTYSPDEHYWVTLHRIPRVPGGYTESTWNSTVRFIHWQKTYNSPECVGKYVRNICIFGAGYLQHLAISDKLFANKLHMSFDPIAIQCMEYLLDYRSAYPEAVKDFLPNYPKTDMFGLS